MDRLVRALEDDARDCARVDGRLDFRNLQFGSREKGIVGAGGVNRLATLELRSRVLRSIDFSGSRFERLRLFDCSFVDCVFDGAQFHDLRAWGCVFSRCTFRRARLRKAILGPLEVDRFNRFEAVDFGAADLSGAVFEYAQICQSAFGHSKLDGVDLGVTCLEGCTFAGRLVDVMFWGNADGVHRRPVGAPENCLLDTEFTEAEFEFVEFRNLVAKGVRWPRRSGYIVLESGYGSAIRKVLTFLRLNHAREAADAIATLEAEVEWLGARDSGVIPVAEWQVPPAVAAAVEQVVKGEVLNAR